MPVETGGSSSLPLPSGASTLAEQQTQTTHLSQIETASETVATTVATAANQTTTNSKLDTLLSQTDGIEASVDGLEGSATTTATNTGTTATNTTAIAGSVDQDAGAGVRIVGSVASILTAEQNPINDIQVTTSGNNIVCQAKGQAGHTDVWTMALYEDKST